MNELAKIVLAAAALLPCHQVGAQTFKCVDPAGKITYSGIACAEIGLKDAGEVKERIQVTPALPPTPRPSPGARSRSEEQPVAKPAAAAAPATPERRCFTTRNANGATVTRCNDKPEE